MARLSAMAKAKIDAQKAHVEAEIAKYQKMISDLRASKESPLLRTHKQKEYHKRIQDLKYQFTNLPR